MDIAHHSAAAFVELASHGDLHVLADQSPAAVHSEAPGPSRATDPRALVVPVVADRVSLTEGHFAVVLDAREQPRGYQPRSFLLEREPSAPALDAPAAPELAV